MKAYTVYSKLAGPHVSNHAMGYVYQPIEAECVSNLTIIGSDNGLSRGRHQGIIWTIAGMLLICTLGTNFSEISSEFEHSHSRKCIWKCHLRIGGKFLSASMC